MKKINRFLPLLIILIGMALIYCTGIYRYFSWDALKTYHHTLKDYIAIHPAFVTLAFICIYITLTALSFPGAIFLTLLGGYLFPLPLSTLYVVFSATCGATLIFLATKTAFGNSLRKKAGPFLKKMEKGFQDDAASYLLFLRFAPLFPFWVVNLAAAFFSVPLWTFIWTTAVGITPGSFAFTFVGSGLEKILDSDQPFSLSLIFNTQLKIALVLLGLIALIPIAIKKWKRNDRNKSA